ncbi:MAG: hypothetical protein ACD_79C00597G0001 [uncultured bacterium]|nr:MAG: hypothetical protein ACD_79C00597G0001 [uncultured bacterium]
MDSLENIIEKLNRGRIPANILQEDRPKQNLNATQINLRIFLQKLVSHFQDTHSEGLRTFELHYGIDTEFISTDEKILSHCIYLLLLNAKEMTTNGMVIVALTKNDSEILIAVKDSGEGIPEKKVNFILSDDSTSNTDTLNQLDIRYIEAKMLTEKNLGKLDIFSSHEAGTICCLILPTKVRRF